MAKAQKQKAVDKWKKKKWFEVFAPKSFEQKDLGETVAEKPELLQNRIVYASVRDLTGQPKKQHITLKFKVVEVQGLKAYTKLVGHEINQNYLKRLIKRHASKIESNQVVQLEGKEKARVKAITISAKKLAKAQETAIRKIMIERIEESAKKKNFDSFVQDIVFGQLIQKIYNQERKIALLKRVEIVKSTLFEGK